MLALVSWFVLGAAVLVAAGTLMARAADVIAEESGMGRLWVGGVLLAGATSLPELATDISAVRMGAVDLAVGDLFGSSMANMLILAAVDLVPRRVALFRRVSLEHALGAGVAVALTALAAAFIVARLEATWLGVSAGSFLLLGVYVAGMRVLYRQSVRADAPLPAHHAVDAAAARWGLRGAAVRFGLASLVVLATAPRFASTAEALATVSGLGHTFVGTWLVGLATSLPEFVASIVAIRLGAFDLAVGNLFGSNAFNMTIFFALDVVHPGSIFAAAAPAHALTALWSIVLMGLALAAIAFRAERRNLLLEPDSVLILLVYGAAVASLYQHVHALGAH